MVAFINKILPPKNFRPMLAAKVATEADMSRLRNYPYMVSPKLDGIRVLLHPQLGAVTRTIKPLPNNYTYGALLAAMKMVPEMQGLDGELTVGDVHNITDKDIFNKSQSGLMSRDGSPDTVFWVFDNFLLRTLPFNERFNYINENYPKMVKLHLAGIKVKVAVVPQYYCHNEQDILDREQHFIHQGFEGAILRRQHGAYKFGRSTLTQQDLIKIKRFEDCEGAIVGFEELYHNENVDEKDAFGLAKRSTKQANLKAGNTLGALRVKVLNGPFKGQEVGLGSGFDQSLRQEIWNQRDSYLNRTVTFKYQRSGSKDAPRFPIFKGLRSPEDVDTSST